MTATSYQMVVAVDGTGRRDRQRRRAGGGARDRASATMPPWLGAVLAGLGLFLTAGLADHRRQRGARERAAAWRRARRGAPAARAHRRWPARRCSSALVLWGGSRWWTAEASQLQRVRALPAVQRGRDDRATNDDRRVLTLRDPRRAMARHARSRSSRYNALLPDHGKLMHLFMVREPDARCVRAPPSRRRVRAQALDVRRRCCRRCRRAAIACTATSCTKAAMRRRWSAASMMPAPAARRRRLRDPDDSWFSGKGVHRGRGRGLRSRRRLAARRGSGAKRRIVAGVERVLRFSVSVMPAARSLTVEPYMGMAAHVADRAAGTASVFAHLHPSGSDLHGGDAEVDRRATPAPARGPHDAAGQRGRDPVRVSARPAVIGCGSSSSAAVR